MQLVLNLLFGGSEPDGFAGGAESCDSTDFDSSSRFKKAKGKFVSEPRNGDVGVLNLSSMAMISSMV